ncbi:MAG: hypothetical protein E4H00_08525 [Myxococcales bacterium]|nr:MAG: hypothetical protein E4H00_08525 [Myxococcales bacterium]
MPILAAFPLGPITPFLTPLRGERLKAEVLHFTETAGLAAVDMRVVRNRSVVAGILEVSDGYDRIVIGAEGQRFIRRVLFGTITRADRQALQTYRHRRQTPPAPGSVGEASDDRLTARLRICRGDVVAC